MEVFSFFLHIFFFLLTKVGHIYYKNSNHTNMSVSKGLSFYLNSLPLKSTPAGKPLKTVWQVSFLDFFSMPVLSSMFIRMHSQAHPDSESFFLKAYRLLIPFCHLLLHLTSRAAISPSLRI